MRVFAYLVVLLICLFGQAAAQEISQYSKVGAIGNWVNVHTAAETTSEKGQGRDSFYPMVDWQYRVASQTQDIYAHYVQTLNTPQGVEDNSVVSVTFDPEYQSVTWHHLHIVRDGNVIDRLELSEFDIYRLETDRKKLIYNGDLQMTYVLPDVRPGDTLDYAYTRHGKNPAIGPHYFFKFQQKYNDVTINFHNRALIHKDLPVFTKAIEAALEPKITNIGNYKSIEWSLDGGVPTTADSDRPDWHFGWPTYHISSYETWADVGKYFARYYAVPNPMPANIAALAHEIRREFDTPELRLRAALGRVQKDIRYLGIELGAGGYIPRHPERVLDRRYGDCKDMTYLLVSLLSTLGIEADPFLVDSDVKGGVSLWLPTHSAFDHIVARAKIGDKVYILDPTKGEQLGDLDHLQQGHFEKGLIVAADSPGLIKADVPAPDRYEDFHESFDIVSDPDLITMTSISTYFMYRADSMRGWLESNGLEFVEKSFLEYYQDSYPNIEQVGDMRIERDHDRGKIAFAVDFKIPNPWEIDKANARKTFTVLAREIDSELPEFDGAKRIHPYKMSHPVRSQQTFAFKLDKSWALEEEDISVDNEAFSYRKKAKADGHNYTEIYSVVSKTDNISAAAFGETMAEIDQIEEGLGIELFTAIEGAGSDDSGWENFLIGAFSILWLSGLLIAFGAFLGRKF